MGAATPSAAGAALAAPSPELPAGVEFRRLTAAAGLHAARLGAGQFYVTGGAEPHNVDLGADGPADVCDCGDHAWRGATCKHILAARAAAGDPAIVDAFDLLATLRAIVGDTLRANVQAGAVALGGMR